MTIFAFFRLY